MPAPPRKLSEIMKEMSETLLRIPSGVPSSEAAHVALLFANAAWNEGVGMDQATLSKAIEPFFSTKDEKGTGLGLWVSQGIVQAHGGSIKLLSRQGRGTTFRVALPIGGPLEHVER